MSDVAATTLAEKADWVEELQRKVFEECVAQYEGSADLRVDDVGESSTSPRLGDVPVSIIVSNIDQSFAQIPHFLFIFLRKSQRTDFLEELRESLRKVARKKCVNWAEFKESSEQWFLKLLNLLQQDGNNNVRLNHISDAPTEDSERDGLSMEEHSDAIDDELSSMNQLETVASCYSLTSSSMGFGTTDSMMESSEETDNKYEDISGIDLKVRIRRFNEETANLRDDLLRAEDTISTLERDIQSTKSALERMSNKYTRVLKENEDQREMLADASQREESYKRDLRKVEKAYSTLEKKVEELEREKENILNLKSRIEGLTKENAALIKQLADHRKKYDEKMVECGCLQEENEELQKKLHQLDKSYEHLQEKILELQDINADLQSKMMSKSDSSSSRLSLTPPPYSHMHAQIHSTPYSRNGTKVRHQDSLFSELKASGYNADDAKMQELRNEVSFYNDEIAVINQQVDDALQDIAAARNEIIVPSVQLIEPEGIQTLKHKITSLIEMVRSSSTAMKAAIAAPAVTALPRVGEDSREKKPDVLPDNTKTSYLSDDRLFGSEKLESDLVDSVTTSLTAIADNKQYGIIDRSASALPEAAALVAETSAEESTGEQEIIVPISEALHRIIEIKNADEEELVEPYKRLARKAKQRSIFTLKKPMDGMNLIAEDSKTPTPKNITAEYGHPKVHVSACGDGPHHDFAKLQQTDFGSPKPIFNFPTTEAGTFKSDFKDCVASPDVSKLDTRFVTIRDSKKTHSVLKPIVSSTEEEKASEIAEKPDSGQNASNEKRRSVSTPDVQESDYCGFRSSKSTNSFDMPITKNELMTSYRCANSSDSSCSLSPKNDDSVALRTEEDSPSMLSQEPRKQQLAPKLGKPVILAPKLKLPDSTVHQTHVIKQEEKKVSKPLIGRTVAQGKLQRKLSCEKISGRDAVDHSKILSSSSNLVKKESCSVGSSGLSNECSNITGIDIISSNNSTESMDVSDTDFSPSIVVRNDKTYAINDTVAEMKKTTGERSSAASVAAAREESTSPRCCSGASGGIDSSSSRVPTVVRAMSSGEDSSAESECDALRASKKSLLLATTAEKKSEVEKPPVESTTVEKFVEKQKKPALPPMLDRSSVEVDSSRKPVLTRRRSNSCTETATARDIKLVIPPTVNGVDNSCQRVTSNTLLPREAIKEDESPKAFPSWTDERLQESGIASFPDIDVEISENLSEEENKKKYTAFSVGLSTDRMTLSKRMILSRRHRDQAEKNFNNEVLKMQQDIKEPRQRNSVSGRVPGLRRPSLCYESPKWEIEKLDRTDSSNSIAELRDIFEQAESRRHSREENNNLIRTSINNLSIITSEHTEEEEVWSNPREDIVPESVNDNHINSLELRENNGHPLVFWLLSRYTIWKPMIWGLFIAFLLGIFLDRVVSSSRRNGAPTSWWSIEEILSQYIQEENKKLPVPRPI